MQKIVKEKGKSNWRRPGILAPKDVTKMFTRSVRAVNIFVHKVKNSCSHGSKNRSRGIIHEVHKIYSPSSDLDKFNQMYKKYLCCKRNPKIFGKKVMQPESSPNGTNWYDDTGRYFLFSLASLTCSTVVLFFLTERYSIH